MVTSEFREMVAGRYGKTPTPISDEFKKQILGEEEAITCRPADLLEPELEKLKTECAEWSEQPEDVLTYAMFPKVAPKFFKERRDRKYNIDKHSDETKKIHMV
jgi:oxaloacetate decarboxylase alpha subunit